MNRGTPFGINKLKILNLYPQIPRMLLNKKKDNDKVKGNKNWEVNEQLNGAIPKTFKKAIQTPVSKIKEQ